ncbi:hypothetical protein AMTRI_Chr02g255300 [Amborella trichopoda]|uniref:Uncharacterized protein n=1 Tax=Amborella trichopoda TaxID=13333 RepID=U5CXA2_AMBTC|nr:transcription factor MYB6 [Amborella trichopoda]ERN14789.1 hypothetical protein AMTR_s00032p00057800 [Amborella trichopoda]|eukprot:XP_006853322.1 transcription factor MYB6 [Amborella trichopoda]
MGRGRAPCCEKVGLNKGAWTPSEDMKLVSYIKNHGHGNWRALPKQAGLLRCGKSCRLRWTNYLRPDIKRGNFSREEEETIIKLHELWGNRWSLIASRLPGRTDNEIKNVWNTHLKKRLGSKVKSSCFGDPSSSCGSSSQSSSSNCTQEDQSNPKEANPSFEFDLSPKNCHPNLLEDTFEIPIEPELGFFDAFNDIFDDNSSLVSSLDGPTNSNGDKPQIMGFEEVTDEKEFANWAKFLERELDLKEIENAQPSHAKDDGAIQPNPCLIDERVESSPIYFDKWPSSPLLF